MFTKLQEKWKVSGWRFVLVLTTFAIGGSLCGFLGKEILNFLNIESEWVYGTVYFILVTLLWPLCVLTVSIPLGQFTFFRNYLRKMGSRFGLGKSPVEKNDTIHLAIFASGTGSNARKLMEYFKNHPRIQVSLLASNKPGVGALHHAADFGISTLIIEKERFFEGDGHVPELEAAHIDYIVLAGFLWKIPLALLDAYPQKIVNIHPALLPKYGGKGMYGHFVHEAVKKAGEKESGITIHLVDEQYDHGKTLFQATTPVLENDTAETIANKVLKLEHAHFAPVVEKFVLNQPA